MIDEKQFVVVTVSGRDRPGITASFSRILLDHDVEIIDIDQASLQDFLGLSFLLDLSGSSAAKDSVLKDLLFEANRLEMQLNFQLLSEKDQLERRDKNLFVVTLFGGTRTLAEISTILGDHKANIEKISNLSRRKADCIELTINAKRVPSLTRLKEALMTASYEFNIDLAIQKMEAYRKSKRIVFFDMDQTLLDMEVVDEMARAAGVYDEVSRVTEKAMRGDLDFEDSLRQRVGLMKGLTEEKMIEVRDKLKLSEGAEELIAILKRLGFKVGVISGGFTFFTEHLKRELDLDFCYANELEFKNGSLTGRVTGDVLDDAEKAKLLHRVSKEMSVMMDQSVAIGDGANDRLMLGQAGLGIAYNAHAGLRNSASMNLGHRRLLNILYILGITEDDIVRAT